MADDAIRAALTELSDDERMFQDSVLEFAADRVAPLVRGMDEKQQMDAGLVREMFRLGLMGIVAPEEYGGAGGSFFDAVLAVEALSAVDPAVGVLVDVQNTLCLNALVRWGTDEQKRRYLPRLAAEMVGAYALSEAKSGSDAFALETRAVRRGNDYVLNGQKLWITNAKEAGLFIVFATIDPEAGYKGVTAFLVEAGAAGFEVGRKEDTLGIRASSTCELIFRDCVVPASTGARRSGQGLQDCDRDAERRAHRDWRADGRAGGWSMGACSPLGQGAAAVWQAAGGVSGDAVSAGGDGH